MKSEDFYRAKEALQKANVKGPIIVYDGKFYSEMEFLKMLEDSKNESRIIE